MRFLIILLIFVSFSSDRRVTAQCDVCNHEWFGSQRLQLGTIFYGCVANLVNTISKISNGFFEIVISPDRPVPLQALLQKLESLPNPNFTNVLSTALTLVDFNFQPLLRIVPYQIAYAPIDVHDLAKYILCSIPSDTKTIPFGLAVELFGAYTSQYFIQRITDLLNTITHF